MFNKIYKTLFLAIWIKINAKIFIRDILYFLFYINDMFRKQLVSVFEFFD